MPRLLILAEDAHEFRQLIEAAHLPELEIAAASSPAEALAEDSEIVFGEARFIREVLPKLPKLRWVQSMSAGIERLMDPALRRDYVLTNARGVFGAQMSEYVIGYLLAHERRIFERYHAQRELRWDRHPGGRLRGKTIGIMGVGSIGAEIAASAKHFGMTVRGYTRSSETCPDVDAYYHGGALLDLTRGCDYLVSVLPNTADTRHVVDAAVLAALPPHAVFINVGRGSAVDEAALLDALETNKIASAVLDVFQQEPLPEDHPFWTAPNLRMTFHTSAVSTTEDLVPVFIENYKRYLRGEKMMYIVDFERGY
ncbi:MAG TPA: D-2-hydroxyacid dehydrogenase [Anaerolineales bacterium]|jgi:phosphoglycerate dehydrogenase-like enzyme